MVQETIMEDGTEVNNTMNMQSSYPPTSLTSKEIPWVYGDEDGEPEENTELQETETQDVFKQLLMASEQSESAILPPRYPRRISLTRSTAIPTSKKPKRLHPELDKYLKRIRFRAVENKGGGDCFQYAINDALDAAGIGIYDAGKQGVRQLREAVCSMILHHKKQFAHFFEFEEAEKGISSVTTWARKLCKLGRWADYREVQAVSMLLHCSIKIHRWNSAKKIVALFPLISPGEDVGVRAEINLLLVNEYHYMALVPTEESQVNLASVQDYEPSSYGPFPSALACNVANGEGGLAKQLVEAEARLNAMELERKEQEGDKMEDEKDMDMDTDTDTSVTLIRSLPEARNLNATEFNRKEQEGDKMEDEEDVDTTGAGEYCVLYSQTDSDSDGEDDCPNLSDASDSDGDDSDTDFSNIPSANTGVQYGSRAVLQSDSDSDSDSDCDCNTESVSDGGSSSCFEGSFSVNNNPFNSTPSDSFFSIFNSSTKRKSKPTVPIMNGVRPQPYMERNLPYMERKCLSKVNLPPGIGRWRTDNSSHAAAIHETIVARMHEFNHDPHNFSSARGLQAVLKKSSGIRGAGRAVLESTCRTCDHTASYMLATMRGGIIPCCVCRNNLRYEGKENESNRQSLLHVMGTPGICALLPRFKCLATPDHTSSTFTVVDKETTLESLKKHGFNATFNMQCNTCHDHIEVKFLWRIDRKGKSSGEILCVRCEKLNNWGKGSSSREYYHKYLDPNNPAVPANRAARGSHTFGMVYHPNTKDPAMIAMANVMGPQTYEDFEAAFPDQVDVTSTSPSFTRLKAFWCRVCQGVNKPQEEDLKSSTLRHLFTCGGIQCPCKLSVMERVTLGVLTSSEECTDVEAQTIIKTTSPGNQKLDYTFTYKGLYNTVIELDGDQHFRYHKDETTSTWPGWEHNNKMDKLKLN
ncbi:hypothetical protein TrCOL_g6918, partial [Triparma columacea]